MGDYTEFSHTKELNILLVVELLFEKPPPRYSSGNRFQEFFCNRKNYPAKGSFLSRTPKKLFS